MYSMYVNAFLSFVKDANKTLPLSLTITNYLIQLNVFFSKVGALTEMNVMKGHSFLC